MKKLIFFLAGIAICLQSFSQYDDPAIIRKSKNVPTNDIAWQFKNRKQQASNIIYTGAAITGVGVIASVVGISKYVSESKKITNGDIFSGQLPALLDNQYQMNKTIPAALLAGTGVVLAGIGSTIIVKGIMKKNDIEFMMNTYGVTGGSMGLKINF